MNRKFTFKIFWLGIAILFFSASNAQLIKMPAGCIAMSNDGNYEDDDDIIALPLQLALMDAAGFKNRFVHVEYNNNTFEGTNIVKEENIDIPAFSGNDVVHMRTSAQGTISRYGYDASFFLITHLFQMILLLILQVLLMHLRLRILYT